MIDEGFDNFRTEKVSGWFYVLAPNGDAFGFSMEGARELRRELTEFLGEQSGLDT